MATWVGQSGYWSVLSNWQSSIPPSTDGSDLADFPTGVYTSIDNVAGYSVYQIVLHTGVTLDVEAALTVGTSGVQGSVDSNVSNQGLLEIGNGATLTFDEMGGDLINTATALYIQTDGVGAEGEMFINGGLGDIKVTLNGVNFDAAVGLEDDPNATLILENGATWKASSGEVFNLGTVQLAGGATANFSALPLGSLSSLMPGVPTAQQVVMSGSNDELVLPKTADAQALNINGYGFTDKIEVAGINNIGSAGYASTTLTLYSGANNTGTVLEQLNDVSVGAGIASTLTAINFVIGTDGTGQFVELISCFTPGTRILMPSGEVAVEDLREGDLVMTGAAGAHVPSPIVWIGHRTIDLKRHPDPWTASPIRIRRGAFGPKRPHRDLLLSPDHAIYVNGGLVPARQLVNGVSIVREMPAAVEYFHIECVSHSIILAENLPVETYLDTGNRAMFDNAGLALLLHPEFAVSEAPSRADRMCAPLWTRAEDVEPIWNRIAACAIKRGKAAPPPHITTNDADLRLRSFGRDIRPVSSANGRYVFPVPAGATEVTIVSRTARPAETQPWVEDQRCLGVAIRDIFLHDATAFQCIGVDDPCLRRGWWRPEGTERGQWRWTDGAGVISLPFAADLIEIEVVSTPHYRVEGGKRVLRRAA